MSLSPKLVQVIWYVHLSFSTQFEPHLGLSQDSIEPLSSQTLPMPEFDAEAIIPDIRPSGRPNRRRRFPRIFKDFLPSGLTRAGAVPDTYQPPPKSTPLPPLVPPSSPNQSSSPTQAVPVASATYSRSEPNMFGLFRTYLRVPTIDPELSTSIDTLADSTTHAVPKPDRSRWWKSFGRPGYQTGKRHKSGSKSGPFAPFLNASVFRLMSWFYSGSNIKSEGELDRLVNEVLLQDDFDREDLRGFRASAEIQRLDEWEDIEAEDTFRAEDGWQEASIRIHVPAENVKFASESVAPEYEIKGLYYRRLIEVVKAAFQDKSALNYHLAPFRLFCQDDPSVPTSDTTFTQVYSEIFNSEAMNEEYETICAKLQSNGQPHLEVVVAAIMLWSDSPSWLNSALHLFGRFMVTLAIRRSMNVASLAHLLHIILRICPLYVSHNSFLQRIFIANTR